MKKKTAESILKNILYNKLRTGELLVLGFAAMILTGALLLWMPASVNGEPVAFIDALFTATSAVCVTGLATVDTGTVWSSFGKVVLLTLIQIGGLGIMTFSVLMFISIGRLPALRDTWVVESMFSANPEIGIRKLVHSIFTFTFLMETIGTILLFSAWLRHGFEPEKALWYAAFHSVSAFCNAGFAFFPNSLEGFASDSLLVLSVAVLIITGGIGFYVALDLWEWVKRRGAHRLSLHTRLVFWTTLSLLVIGTVLLLYGERNSLASGADPGHKLLSAFFQSTTARTAGFNTIPIATLSNIGLLTMIILMFFGASPGSCGGGVHTTSLALMAALVFNRLRGNTEVNIQGRTIPEQTVHRVVSVIVIGVLLVVLSTLLLLLTQAQDYSYPQDRGLFIEYLFESVSALGTVGLSMGVTTGLNLQGKLIIIVMMFVGRVGLLTLAYSVFRPRRRVQMRYSTEDVML